MTCGGVFADGFFTQFAVCAFGCVHFAQQVNVFPLNVAQTQRCHVGQGSFGSCFFDIYQGIAAYIAEIGCVRQFANPYTVQYNNNCSFQINRFLSLYKCLLYAEMMFKTNGGRGAFSAEMVSADWKISAADAQALSVAL